MEENLQAPLAQQSEEEQALRREIQEGLRGIIDPGTGLDVVRMGLVRGMELRREGKRYRAILTFRPSSPVCPMAFKLAWDMKQCLQAVEKIEDVDVKVEGYNRASELEAILREEQDSGAKRPSR